MGQVVKYGHVRGPEVNMEYPVAASEVFKHLGGAFVAWDSNNRIAVAGASSTAIIGWAYGGDFTASSTAGNTRLVVNTSLDSIYRMPLAAATTEATLQGVVGESCDIIVTSSVQYADITASAIDSLYIVGYEYFGSALGEQTVLVKLYWRNIAVRAGVV